MGAPTQQPPADVEAAAQPQEVMGQMPSIEDSLTAKDDQRKALYGYAALCFGWVGCCAGGCCNPWLAIAAFAWYGTPIFIGCCMRKEKRAHYPQTQAAAYVNACSATYLSACLCSALLIWITLPAFDFDGTTGTEQVREPHHPPIIGDAEVASTFQRLGFHAHALVKMFGLSR